MKWIPVEKDIPEIGKEVLTFDGLDFRVLTLHLITETTDSHGKNRSLEWVDDGWNCWAVTHWMPLFAPTIKVNPKQKK